MRQAVTLIELLFVFVIIGILIGVGFYSFKPKNLQNDIKYIKMHILKTKYKAMNFSNGSLNCFDLEKSKIKELAQKEHYAFKSDIDTSVSKICFDGYGRPFDKNGQITSKKRLLTLSYRGKSASIVVYPLSGFILINY